MGVQDNKIPIDDDSPHIVKLAASFFKNSRLPIKNPISSWEQMEKELEALSNTELEVLLALVTDMKNQDWGDLESTNSNGK